LRHNLKVTVDIYICIGFWSKYVCTYKLQS